MVTDGVNGFRPPPRSPERFAQHIGDLLANRTLYERCAAAALEAARFCRLEAVSRRWDEILQSWGIEPLADGPCRLRRLAAGGWPSRKQIWESSRHWSRATAARGLAVVPPSWWLGRDYRRRRDGLHAAQRWNEERIRDYQLRHLRRVVHLAWERCAYYRRSWRTCGFEPGDLRGIEDLAALPVIDRTALDEAPEDFLAIGPEVRGVDFVTTGGTGGAPLRFCIDRGRSSAEFAHLAVSWERAGYRLGGPLAIIRGRAVEARPDGLRHEFDPLLRQHWYSGLHLTDQELHRYLEHIATLGPCWLHVYPSVAVMLARWVQRSGQSVPQNIRGLLAESEIVYAGQRELVEAVFGSRLFACYGQSEKLVLAAECEHSSDYHVWPTYGFFELLDDDGQPVRTPGQRGEIAGTGFLNTVMPFVRYRTGDHATYVGPRCTACNRNHPLLRDISGHRIQETLELADGAAVPWAALNVHDDTFRNVRRFQFIQERPGRAELLVIPAAEFGDADRRRIQRALEQRLGGRLQLTLRLVEDIPASPRGKAIYVARRRSRPARTTLL
jgi:phenylacetate-CoA ligase